jgi:N,N'-diacetyllegionaminate synthase
MSSLVSVGGHELGPGRPCLIAAELGINHNGDMGLARRMIDAAAEAGADAVKFQSYHTEDFLSDRTLSYTYMSQGREVTEPQYDMFKRCELAPDQLKELAGNCRRRGVIFFSTPTNAQGVKDAVEAGAPILKNGSDYLQNLSLLRAMARTGLPTAISTGMATFAEIKAAADAYRGAGGSGLILVLCTSAYPTPPEGVALRRLPALAEAFNCPVGFSDHTEGVLAAVGAVTLGACFLEKHFTIDRNLPGPDQRFSSDPSEFRALVEAVRCAELALGSSELAPQAAEAHARAQFRLSCVASCDFVAGHRLAEEDIAFRRPATGLPPSKMDQLVGRTLVRAVHRGEQFQATDCQP